MPALSQGAALQATLLKHRALLEDVLRDTDMERYQNGFRTPEKEKMEELFSKKEDCTPACSFQSTQVQEIPTCSKVLAEKFEFDVLPQHCEAAAETCTSDVQHTAHEIPTSRQKDEPNTAISSTCLPLCLSLSVSPAERETERPSEETQERQMQTQTPSQSAIFSPTMQSGAAIIKTQKLGQPTQTQISTREMPTQGQQTQPQIQSQTQSQTQSQIQVLTLHNHSTAPAEHTREQKRIIYTDTSSCPQTETEIETHTSAASSHHNQFVPTGSLTSLSSQGKETQTPGSTFTNADAATPAREEQGGGGERGREGGGGETEENVPTALSVNPSPCTPVVKKRNGRSISIQPVFLAASVSTSAETGNSASAGCGTRGRGDETGWQGESEGRGTSLQVLTSDALSICELEERETGEGEMVNTQSREGGQREGGGEGDGKSLDLQKAWLGAERQSVHRVGRTVEGERRAVCAITHDGTSSLSDFFVHLPPLISRLCIRARFHRCSPFCLGSFVSLSRVNSLSPPPSPAPPLPAPLYLPLPSLLSLPILLPIS